MTVSRLEASGLDSVSAPSAPYRSQCPGHLWLPFQEGLRTAGDVTPPVEEYRQRRNNKKNVGLWIDHKKAVIVVVTDKGEETGLVISKVEKQLRRSGDSPLDGSHEPQQVPADNRRQRRLTGQLNIYYDAVISCIREAESILILGPGEAKGELQKRLKKVKLGERIVGTETVDKMTELQITAKVRQYFHGNRGS